MKHVIFALALMTTASAATAADSVGLDTLSIATAHHGGDMNMSIMYPAEGGTETVLGENPVFFGTTVREHAKPLPGKHPIILFSHGWGGNYVRMAWLTAGLAAKGAIVVAVNHPNSTTRDIQYQSALNHWTRVQDLTAALDYVLKDPALARSIDPKRIYAAGYSYGGWTALSIAGLKGRRDGFEQYCKAAGDSSQFCRELRKEGVEISAIDRAKYEASYKDSRIVAAAAIDPGLTWGLTASDVAGFDVPVLLIGLGHGKDRLEATDTSATGSNFEALFPAAKVEHIAPAMHFTALGICKPAGEAILIEEKDDPVCTDPPRTDRKAVLDRIVELLAEHFGLN
jgi:predicted dienelactone hydrolase